MEELNTNKIKKFLKRVVKPEDDRCFICKRTYGEIVKAAIPFIKEGLCEDEIPVYMSYELSNPICARCYTILTFHKDTFTSQVIKSNEKRVWSGCNDMYEEFYFHNAMIK